MHNTASAVRTVLVAIGLAFAGAAYPFDMGNMMNPSKWMGGDKDRDRYDDYGYPGYGYGGWPGYGYGGWPGYGYGGYPGYGYGGYPGYPGGYGYGGAPGYYGGASTIVIPATGTDKETKEDLRPQ